MAGDLQHRYICFCGLTVIGATVCSDCARAMVTVLLNTAIADPTRAGEAESAQPVASTVAS